MTPETAIALVKKYAGQHGVRATARIFNINASTVSRISNNKGSISGFRIVAKVAAAGTFTCPCWDVLMFPEICRENQIKVRKLDYHGLPREQRRLYGWCPSCKTGKELCQAK